jgi:hypothetical protein
MPCTFSGSDASSSEPRSRKKRANLFRVQRVSACTLEQRGLRLGGQQRLVEDRCDHTRCVGVGER